jgi:PAS domain S-box-containing protein
MAATPSDGQCWNGEFLSLKMNSEQYDSFGARILIVDDHPAVRSGLKNLIALRSGWIVCGEASDGDEAVALALELKPSAIVMDVSMPRMNGLEATRRIREQLPNSEILIVSQHDSESVVQEAQRAGARGFVVKSHLSADLLPALEAALLHSSRISAPLLKAWHDAISNNMRPSQDSFEDPGPHDDLDLLAGGGQMGTLIRAHDWSRTPFGPVSEWPQSLRTALRICLDSRFPIVIWWGPELRLLYNDAWRPALGTTKYPQALGAPGKEVWSDIWETIGPSLETVMQTGKATWENDQLLLFDRNGYLEETYWTYSYSAIRLSSGEVGGVFSAMHEVTDRVLSARRLKTLREVADQVVQARNEDDACTLAMHSMVRNPTDCPFAMIFLLEGTKANRVAASFDAARLVPNHWELTVDDPWRVKATTQTRSAQLFAIENPGSLPAAPFGNRCKQAISIPLLNTSRELVAVLTVGISPYRALDDSYREFLESLAKNLAGNISNAAISRARNEGAELERKLRAEADLERRRFRDMIEVLPAAIYTTDADGRITHFNRAAVEFSGRVPQIGKDCWCVSWKLFKSDGTPLPHDQCPMAVALKEGRIVEGIECIAERPDGKRVWFAPYPRPIRDSGGKIIGGINMLVDITERKRVEQATGLLAGIVASSDDAIISKNLDGVITSWNKSAERIFGYSSDETIGQPVTLIIPPERANEEVKILERLRRGERVDHFETVRRRKDGTLIDVSLTISPVKDSSGKVVGASKVARDITEETRSAKALRASEERLRSILETTPECVKLVAPDGTLLHMNPPGLQMVGASCAEEVVGQSIYTLIAPEDRGRFRAFNQRVCAGEKDSLEFDIVSLGGERRHMESHAAPLRDFDGDIVQLAVTRDVSDRKRAEEILRQHRERFDLVAKASQVGFWFCDLPFDKLNWDDRVKEHFWLPPDAEVTIDTFYERLHPDDREHARAAIAGSIENDSPYEIEYRTVAPDGREKWIRAIGRTFYDAEDRPVRFDGLTLDITDRRLGEQRAQQLTAEAVAATAKFRAVFEQTTVFAGIMTKDGVMVEANKLFLEGCGYTAEQVLGRPFWQTGWWRHFPESQEKIRTATPLAAQGIPYREMLHYSWADGTERLVDFALYPIVDDAGQVLFLHPAGVDITDLKRAEENYRNLAEHLELEVRERTKELEERNVDILRQSAQLQDLSWRLLRTQDEERRYVARELHDSAGQTLALLGMSLSQHIREAERSSPALRKSSEEVEKLVRQLQNDIRTTSYLLHPPLLDEAGLISALTWYVDGLRARSSLEIDLTISEPFGRLPRELELVIFRLVQECLTNIHRHSGSKTASIRIRKEKETVLVEVQDQGRGIPPEKFANVQAQGSGVGIRGMRERVLQFQGVLDINSSSSGTTVSAVMHIPETAVPRQESGSVKIAI